MAMRAGALPGREGVTTRITAASSDRSGPAMRTTTGPSWRGGGSGAAAIAGLPCQAA